MTVPLHRLALHRYAAAARETMSGETFAYVAGGAGRGGCARRSEEAWADILLRPQTGRRVEGLDLSAALPGLAVDWPCLVAPMAHQRLAHPEGERAAALAAQAQGAGMVLSCQTSVPPEEMPGPFWMQLYLREEARDNRALVRRAEAAGATGFVITMDAPLSGIREAEIEAGFALPDGVRPVMLDALPPEPPAAGAADLLARAPGWEGLAALVAETALPVLAKGAMTPEAASAALEAGCAGVIVSNHGGRVLEGLPATARALPAIRAALPGATILVDGGVRSGEDLCRALALGADAVLVGRPVFYALSLGGAQGVSTALRRLRDEFAVAMGLMGCATVAEMDGSRLWAD